jgi:hypothetical protein
LPILQFIEAHAALTQAITSILSVLISAPALIYAIYTLKTLQRQTEASVAQTRETFRPIIEVGGVELGVQSTIRFSNKGQGPALNFRWRVAVEPERWQGWNTNIISSGETGLLRGRIDWKSGLVLSYNSVASKPEIITYVTFNSDGTVSNQHVVKEGTGTRLGWAVMDPSAALPGFNPAFLATLPISERIRHWWRLKRGKERRL